MQAVGVTGWALGIWLSGTVIHVPPHMWGWIALAALCAGAYSYLLTRASSRGDISVVGPVLALAPIFSILPDWWLTDTLPRGVGCRRNELAMSVPSYFVAAYAVLAVPLLAWPDGSPPRC